MKNVFAKILVLALCCIFALSGLIGCGKMKDQIADLQNQIDQNKDNDKADTAALEELKTLVSQIKDTANSAATATALEKVVADLAAVKETADAAATAAKLAEVEENLKALVATNGTDDAAVKAELEAAIAGVKAIADAAATKAAFDKAIADITKVIEDEQVTVGAELTKIKNSITAAEAENAKLDAALKALEAAAATKADVETELNAVKKLIDDNTTTDADTKAELVAAIADVKATADAAATKAELVDAVAALNTAVESATTNAAADLAAAKTELEGKLATLESAVNGELETVKNLIAANGTADADAKAELEAAIDAVKATANAAATKAEFDAAVEALNAAVAANTTALDDAVAALEAKIATVATKTELQETIAALTADVVANNMQIAANVEAIAAAATKAELEDAIANIDAKLTGIDSTITALETSLQGKIDALDASVKAEIEAVNTALGNLQTKDTELVALIEGLQAQIDEINATLGETDNTQDDFAEKYVEATKILTGELKLVIKLAEDGSVAKIIVVDKDNKLGDDYSLAAFNAITVDPKYYVGDDYNAFLTVKKNIEFFLTRAISAEAIVGYFRDLYDYIADMPELNETLRRQLAAKTTLTTALDDLAAIEETIAKILENEGTVDLDNQAAYDLLKAAHNNLLAADADSAAVEAEIEKIGYVVYDDESMQAIKAASGAYFAYNETYFTNEDYNKYYADDATTLVGNYNVLVAAEARYVELGNAADDARVLATTEKGLEYANDVRPLWNEKADLDAALATFQAWCAQYNISEKADAETISIIFHVAEYGFNPVDSLKVAVLHADAMYGIYTNTVFAEGIVGVEALNNAVAALMASSETVLYTDYEVAMAYASYYETLEARIKFVKTFNETDGNYPEMKKSIAVDFAVYCETQKALYDANEKLDEFHNNNAYLLIPNEKGEIPLTFNHWTIIETLGKEIQAVIDGVNVVVDDANYVAFAAENDPFALHAELLVEYTKLTAKVREIYDTVNELLNNSNAIALTFGNDITEFLAELTKIMALGVTDVNLVLPGATEADDTANLADLMENLETVIDEFCKKAEAAEEAAREVTAAIATLTNYKTNNLNDYAAIKAVKALLDAWVEAWLVADVEDANGDVHAALVNVSTVQIYRGETGAYYVFIKADIDETAEVHNDYTTCVTVMNAAQDHYDAAKAAWDTIGAELDRLTNLDWTIHNKKDFEAADAAYVKFINDYYNGMISVTITTGENGAIVLVGGEFGEIDAYAEFVVERAKCYAYADEAIGAANKIKDLINGLASEIGYSNYAAQLDLIVEINGLIEGYKKYCGDICNACIPEALRITLAEKEATALLYEYAAEAKAKANDATDLEIDKSLELYAGMIPFANDGERKFAAVINTINYTLESGKSAIDKKAPCCVYTINEETGEEVYGNHADANKDHKCDYCDTVVSECPVATGTAHTCDCNATSECPVVAGTAHTCGCGATSDCADVDTDADHNCDVCGAPTTECVVANGTAHECNCGATTDCPVAAGTAHNCGCGATSDCTDVDPVDEKCDVCGADVVPATPAN